SGAITITLSNTGGGTLTISSHGVTSLSTNPNDFAKISGGNCSTTTGSAHVRSPATRPALKPTSTCTRAGLYRFYTNVGTIQTTHTGPSTFLPVASPPPASILFPYTTLFRSSGAITITLSNTGGGTLTISSHGVTSLSTNPNDFSKISGGNCST